MAVEEESEKAFGNADCLAHAGAVMFHLGNLLLADKKFRVTIECDPETGQFELFRELLS